MLPLSMGMPSTGPLTPEMQTKLRKIRFCVIGIFVAAVGRLATGDMPFNELLCGIGGVFLLRDDPWLIACYTCLASSPLGQCAGPSGGGLSCLMPFLFIASFNCIFLVFRLPYGGPFILVSFCCQSMGAVLAWRLNYLVTLAAVGEFDATGQGQPLTQPLTSMRMHPQPGMDGLESGFGRSGPSTAGSADIGGMSEAPGRGILPSRGHAPPSRNSQSNGFVAFTGYAQRLGEAAPHNSESAQGQ
mmetsp:Transcript_93084/g.216328  ORF Transcript_93084/g.216328 Transcript_93084/m.216328 type:complete len:244 (-) Transcript_93084:216-947(-)